MPDEALMEQLLQNNPDSLATLLEDNINLPELRDAQKADYAYWLTKTHQQQHRSLINDTLIHFALDFYKETDSPRLLETYQLAATQLNWAGDLLKKREVLEDAVYMAESKKDTDRVHIFCGGLVFMYKMPDEAAKVDRLIQVTKNYFTGTDLLAYVNLCRLFIVSNQPDSVVKYARLGAGLANRMNDENAEYNLVRYSIEALNATGKSKEALIALHDMESRLPVGNELKLNYISTWITLNNLDSARANMDSIQLLVDRYKYEAPEETNVMEVILMMYEMIIQIKEGKTVSLFEIGRAPDNILLNSRRMIANDRERQVVEHRLLKKNLTLDIERGQLRQRILWIGIFVLLIIAVLIYVYQRKLLKKERSVQQAKEQLRHYSMQLSENESIVAKNEELIGSLSAQLDESGDLVQEVNLLVNENEALKQKNEQLHKDIELYSKSMDQKDRELDAFGKLTTENAKLHERERFLTAQLIAHTKVLDQLGKKPRYIEDSQWPEIIHAVNQLFDGFSYRLHTDFPSLTEEDIRYTCLIKLRLSTSVIALLMGISPSSVTKRKQRIKDKMNQQRPSEIRKDQPLEIYIWN